MANRAPKWYTKLGVVASFLAVVSAASGCSSGQNYEAPEVPQSPISAPPTEGSESLPVDTQSAPESTPTEVGSSPVFEQSGEIKLTNPDGFEVGVSYSVASLDGFVADTHDSKPGYAKFALPDAEWTVTFRNLSKGRTAPVPASVMPAWGYPGNTPICGLKAQSAWTTGRGDGSFGGSIKSGDGCVINLIDFAVAAQWSGKRELAPGEEFTLTNTDVPSTLFSLGVPAAETAVNRSLNVLNEPSATGFILGRSSGLLGSSAPETGADTRTCTTQQDLLETTFADAETGASLCRLARTR